MRKAQIIIKSGKSIPALGLSNKPDTYVYLVQCNGKQHNTGISVASINPIWGSKITVQSNQTHTMVYFYVFNNNKNHLDEILGYCRIQLCELLTRVPTSASLRLYNVRDDVLDSYLNIEHNDFKPDDITMVFDSNSCLKLSLLTDLSPEYSIILEYGSQSTQLCHPDLSERTLAYQAIDKIDAYLLHVSDQPTSRNFKVNCTIMVGNLTQCTPIKLTFHHQNRQHILHLCGSIIPNALLPKDHNLLNLQVSHIITQPAGKIPTNWTLRVNGSLNYFFISKMNAFAIIYIENGTSLQLDYYDEAGDQMSLEGLEPACRHQILVNSLSWSAQKQTEVTVKLQNTFKGSLVILTLNLSLVKNNEEQMPRIQQPKILISQGAQRGCVKVACIRMSNCFLGQVLPEGTKLQFVHQNTRGFQTSFCPFVLKDKQSTQYTVNTRVIMSDGGRGTLYLITVDHNFGNDDNNELQTKKDPRLPNQLINYYIFKVEVERMSVLPQSRILFNQRFLSFAKKVSVTSVCKKYNKMLHDQTLRLKPEVKNWEKFEPGELKIYNCKVISSAVKRSGLVKIQMMVDGNSLNIVGQTGKFLLERSVSMYVTGRSFQIMVYAQAENTIQLKRHSYYTDFTEIFGTPIRRSTYKTKFKVSADLDIEVFYSFTYNTDLKILSFAPKLISLNQHPRIFNVDCQVNLRLKSAFFQINEKRCVVRVNRGSTITQSLEYYPNNNLVLFRASEKIYLQPFTSGGTKGDDRYIFFSAYCLNPDSQEDKPSLRIYTGYMDVKTITGKGVYELTLSNQSLGDQRGKKTILLNIEISNDLEPPFENGLIILESISCSLSNIFKNIYNYYLVAELDRVECGLYQGTLNPQGVFQFAPSNSFHTRKGQIITFKLFSSTKTLTKETFWSSPDKELIGSGKTSWTDLNSEGSHIMTYLPPRDSRMRYNSAKLGFLQRSVKFELKYKLQQTNATKTQTLTQKKHHLDLDVLHSGAALLNVHEIIPIYRHGKYISFNLMPMNFEFCCHSKMKVNKQFVVDVPNMYLNLKLQATINDNSSFKRVTTQASINLKAKNIKTYEKYGLNIEMEGLGIIKADLIVLSSRFTQNCEGTLQIKQIALRGQQYDFVELRFLQSENEHRVAESVKPSSTIQIKNGQGNSQDKFQTKVMTHCLHLTLTSRKTASQIRSIVYLAKIEMEKLSDKQFEYSWVIKGQKSPILVTLKMNYIPYRLKKSESVSLSYLVPCQPQERLEYRGMSNQKLILHVQKVKNTIVSRPVREKGYRVVLKLPESLVVEQQIQRAQLITVNQLQTDKLSLDKVAHCKDIFARYYQQLPQIKGVRLYPDNNLIIESLGNQKNVQKFIINQSPRLICTLTTEPYAIVSNTKSKNEQWIFKVNVHALIDKNTIQRKPNNIEKIMALKNSPHDQILTQKFSLLIKHGDQRHIIRDIDESGRLKSSFQSREFGFIPSVDQIEIYLFIQNWFNQKETFLEDGDPLAKCKQNWMQFMPICFAKIDINKIAEEKLVAVGLQRLPNQNITLDSSLLQIIENKDIITLFDFSMRKAKWGHISITLDQVSELKFTDNKNNDRELIYFTLSVQNSRRKELSLIITEARHNQIRQSLIFRQNRMSFFYQQEQGADKNQTFTLKITARYFRTQTQSVFLQKRIDITDYLTKRQSSCEKRPLIVQLKSNDTNNLCQPFQICTTVTNSQERPSSEQKLSSERLFKVMNENVADIVSFKEQKDQELFLSLARSQHLTLFLECLDQIKESFIYLEGGRERLLFSIIGYLQFYNSFEVISNVLQILELDILKNSKTVTFKLENINFLKQYLLRKFLIICKADEQKPSENNQKIRREEFDAQIQEATKNQNYESLYQLIQKSKTLLFSNAEVILPASRQHFPHIMRILATLSQNSNIIASSLLEEFNVWLQIFAYRESHEIKELIHLYRTLVKVTSQRDQKTLIKVIQIMISRTQEESIIVEMWGRLKDQQTKSLICANIIIHIESKLAGSLSEFQRSVKGLRTLLRELSIAKNGTFAQQLQPLGQKLYHLMITCLSQDSNNILLINNILECLALMHQLGVLPGTVKLKCQNLIKNKHKETKQNSIKMIYANFLAKIDTSGLKAKKGAKIEKTEHPAIYKKYLISSD